MVDLTKEQYAAAHDTSNRVVIVAPPGSGKTATLAARCAAVADRGSSVPGTRAVAITFTRRAAAELEERAPGAQASTFHGLAVRLKRLFERDPFSVYDSVDSTDIACMVGEELGILKPGGYVKRDLAAKKVLKDAAGRRRYVQMLRQARAVDYQLLVDDGLAHAARPHAHDVFSSSHVLLDEQQDTDAVQMELVNRLAPAAITIVGDVRQSIYSFRGAAPEILLDAYRRPELGWSPHSLTANFRSVPAVVALGNRIAESMTFDAPGMVAMRPSTGPGAVRAESFDTSDAEAEVVADWTAVQAAGWESGAPAVFVLSRNWRGLARTREALTAAGTAHVYLGDAGDFWQAEPVKMLLRAASLTLNPHQDPWTRMLANWPSPRCSALDLAKAAEVAAREDAPLCHVLAARMPAKFGFWVPEWFERAARSQHALAVVNELARAFDAEARYRATGRTTKAEQVPSLLMRVEDWTATTEDPSLSGFLDWLADGGATEDAPESPIVLSTVHGSKGLEAPAVAVVGLDAKGFHESGPEERRLFFVAATRARDRLLLTRSETHHGDDVGPSTFWTEATAP